MNRELYEKLIKSQMMNGLKDAEETRGKLEHCLDGRYKKILYIKGETICREGWVDDNVYFLERGKVIVARKDSDDNEYSGGYFMPGEFFGFSSIVSAPEEACFRALTNCSIYVINSGIVNEFMEKDEDSRRFIMSILVNTIRVRTVRQGNLTMGGCRASFVNFILEHVEGFGKLDEEENVVVSLDVNLIDIAQILNMTRETLSRIVSEMKHQGIIDTKRRYIKIMDMEKFMA
jgi:CRP-like cAMP-binding protein